jgi:hypothetical protein
MACFVGLDNPTSSAVTRATLGWDPQGPDLLRDMRENGYFTSVGKTFLLLFPKRSAAPLSFFFEKKNERTFMSNCAPDCGLTGRSLAHGSLQARDDCL